MKDDKYKCTKCDWVGLEATALVSGAHCPKCQCAVVPLETQYTDEPICPNCGYEEPNAWEIDFPDQGESDTEMDCGNCDKPLEVYRSLIVSYSTFEVKKVASSANLKP